MVVFFAAVYHAVTLAILECVIPQYTLLYEQKSYIF